MASDAAKAPIGFWLKKADKAITRYTVSALAKLGLERTDWQALNLVNEAYGNATQAEVFETMRRFVDKGTFNELLLNMTNKEWIEIIRDEKGARIVLTKSGERVFAKASEIQARTRTETVKGISQEDYAITIKTLQHICKNLEDTKPGPVQ